MPLRASPLEKVRSMVALAIRGLGADPDHAMLGPDAWLVKKGSAAVVVRIVQRVDKPAHLVVSSPVMRVAPKAGLKDKLLALNFEMAGLAAYAVSPEGEVHLMASRTTDGIAAEDIARLVAQVAHFGDLHDDALLAEYGRDFALPAPLLPARTPAPVSQPAEPDKPRRAGRRAAK